MSACVCLFSPCFLPSCDHLSCKCARKHVLELAFEEQVQRAKSEVEKANIMRLEKDVSDRDSRRKADAMRDMERVHDARLKLVEERLKTMKLGREREAESEQKRLQDLAVALGLPPNYLQANWRLQGGGGNADAVGGILPRAPAQPQTNRGGGSGVAFGMHRSATVPAKHQAAFPSPFPPEAGGSRGNEGGRKGKHAKDEKRRRKEKKEKKRKRKGKKRDR